MTLATGLTISGPRAAVERVIGQAKAVPHAWSVERRWTESDGDFAVRLRWKDRPSYRDVGGIVFLAQKAAPEGVSISDTSIVQTGM